MPGLPIVLLRNGLLLSCAGGGKELAYLRLKLSVVEWVVKIVRHRGRRIMDKQLWVGRSSTAKAPNAREQIHSLTSLLHIFRRLAKRDDPHHPGLHVAGPQIELATRRVVWPAL